MILEGVYRRFVGLKGGKAPLDIRLTAQESVAIGQVELPNMEMSRAGRRFWLGNSAAITGIAPVAALPTTTATWLLWNADPTATYFFEELGFYLTSGTPAAAGAALVALVQAPAQVGANYAGVAISSMSNGARQSKAILKQNITITQPAAPNWYPLNDISAPAIVFPAAAGVQARNIQGAIAVPPGQGLAMTILSGTGTTPLFAPFARWVEQETDME